MSEKFQGRSLNRRQFLKSSLVVGGAVNMLGVGAAYGAAVSASPKRGGTLNFGVSSGGNDTLDPQKVSNWASNARALNLHDCLVRYDENRVLRMNLAEEMTAEKPDQWLIRIKPDVVFHDGKPFTIDDVIYTMRRIVDPEVASGAAGFLQSFDPDGVTKLDNHTCRLKLKVADVFLDDAMTNWTTAIVPVGYDVTKPVGTGAFMLESHIPGKKTVLVRNPNYWMEGLPYIDNLIITNFTDDQARINSLLGGQSDVIDNIPYTMAKIVQRRGDLKILEDKTFSYIPMHQRLDLVPFKDGRVRKAFRLMVDRQQMVDQVYLGYGDVMNDVFGVPADPIYDTTIPQREVDIPQAKWLLKQAGYDGDLTVELISAPVATGAPESATLFAEQAKAAGVNVKIKSIGTDVFYGPQWLSWPFCTELWTMFSYVTFLRMTLNPNAPWNEEKSPPPEQVEKWESLYGQAVAELDVTKRQELLGELQKMEWEDGAHILWGRGKILHGHKATVHDIPTEMGMGILGMWGFKHAWMD